MLTSPAAFFSYDFLVRALVAGALVGLVSSQLGVFVVLRKMSFFSDAIAHASLAGIALGLLLGIHPLLGAIGVAIVISLGIAYLQKHSTIPVDTIIGVFFSASIAVGVLILGFLPGYRADLFGYLFGDILGVAPRDIVILAGMTLITVVLLWRWYRTWIKIAFDPDLAAIEGVNVARHDYVYLLVLALTVALGIQLVGVILIGPLIIIPAAAAKNMSPNLRSMFLLSALVAVGATVLGLLAAYALNLAAGPTIVVVATLAFALSFLFRRGHG